jgi:hypothetical protein
LLFHLNSYIISVLSVVQWGVLGFVYRDVRSIVFGVATLTKMEDYGWLRQIRVSRRRGKEAIIRRVSQSLIRQFREYDGWDGEKIKE